MAAAPFHVRVRFDGATFVPEIPVDLPVGEVFDFWARPGSGSGASRQPGSAKGLPFFMADDFDDPLEEFAEYR